MHKEAKTRDPEFSYDESSPIAVHLPGHDYGDVEALTLAAQFWLDEEATWDDDGPVLPEDGFEPPRKVWLRVIPWNDSGSGLAMMHHYQSHPGVGARPVTLVREARRMVACRACGAPATTGLDYDGGHYLYAFHPADRDRHGRVWLCRGCEAEISQHRSAIYAQVHQPCPDCGHSLGRHERYGKGPATPCGFASDPDCGCPCTHPSPHSAVLDFEDLRSIPSLPHHTEGRAVSRLAEINARAALATTGEGEHVAREVFTADGIPFVRCSCTNAKSPTSSRWLSEHVPNGGVAELQAVVKRQAGGQS